MSIYAFDMDGVIAENRNNEYWNSRPNRDVIRKINNLYKAQHKIKIFTGRGSSSGKDWRELTEKQLKDWGVRYHELIFGKTPYDYFIDDKAINIVDFMGWK